MKEVNIYIRVHQVRNLENERVKYIGCLLLEFNGKHKYVFIENVGEASQRHSMLRLVCNSLNMITEPCEIVIHSLNDITCKKLKHNDLWDEIMECVYKGEHKISFSVWKDPDDKRKYIFNKFKRKLDGYKSGYKTHLQKFDD